MEKAKKAYHLAARTLEQLKGQLDIYERDAMTTTDALKKLKDKLSKAETENDKTKDKYRDRFAVRYFVLCEILEWYTVS